MKRYSINFDVIDALLQIQRVCALAVAFVCAILPCALHAQENEEEEVFELSPFTVDASSDSGYGATETLGGTRLKGDIRDTPVALSILTEDFLDDIGATDLNSMADFLPSTEVFTNVGSDANGNDAKAGDVITVRGFKTRTRLRNFFNTEAFSDRYVTSRITFSRGPNALLFGIGNPGGLVQIGTNRAYFGNNRGSMEYQYGSRGSHRLSFDQNYELIEDRLAFRVDALRSRQEGFREPTYNNTDGLYLTTTINPFDNDGATSIRLNYEINTIDRVAARPWALFDSFSTWEEAGAPLYNNLTDPRPSNSPSLENPFRRFEGAYIDIKAQDAIAPFRTQRITRGDNKYNSFVRSAGPFANGVAFNSLSIAEDFVPLNPLDVLLNHFGGDQAQLETWLDGLGEARSIPESWANGEQLKIDRFTFLPGTFDDYNRDVDVFTFFVEQKLARNFFVEIAGNIEDSTSNGLALMRGSDQSIQYDPNLYLPDGSPNPYAGIAYVGQHQFGTDDQNSSHVEEYRATASYDFDLTQGRSEMWNLGQHKLSALYSTRSSETEFMQDRTHIITWDGAPITDIDRRGVRSAGTRAKGRYYLLPGEPPYIPEPWIPFGDDPSMVEAGWLTFSANRRERDLDSFAIGAQSYFFDDRLVLTYGWRKDTLKRKQTTQVLVTAETEDRANDMYVGEVDIAETHATLADLPKREWQNRSQGAVFHVLRNESQVSFIDRLSVFYNQATNVSGSDVRYSILYEPIDPLTGDGKDWGIKFGLFERKLTGSLTWYKTAQNTNFTNGGASILAGRGAFDNIHGKVIEVYDPDDEIVARKNEVGTTWVPVFNSVSEGLEFQLVWNATKNLRIRGTYSNQTNVRNSFAEDIEAFYAEVRPRAQAFIDSVEAQGDDASAELQEQASAVEQQLINMDEELPRKKALNGAKTTNLPAYQASLVASYRMSKDSVLKGFSFGGNFRYRASPVLAFEVLDNQSLNLDNAFEGPSLSTYGFFAKYETKIGDGKYKWSIRAAVSNPFNDTDDIASKAIWDKTTEQFKVSSSRFVEPRTFTVTSKISW